MPPPEPAYRDGSVRLTPSSGQSFTLSVLLGLHGWRGSRIRILSESFTFLLSPQARNPTPAGSSSTMADTDTVLIEETQDGVRALRLNRPKRKNALTGDLGEARS